MLCHSATICPSSASYTSAGMAVSKRAPAHGFSVLFSGHSGSGHTYAPWPDFFPVLSSSISPSGVFTIRSSAFFVFHFPAAHTLPLGYLTGLLHCCRSFPQPPLTHRVGRLDVDLIAGQPRGQTGVLPSLPMARLSWSAGTVTRQALPSSASCTLTTSAGASAAAINPPGPRCTSRCRSSTPQLVHDGVHALPTGAYARADGVHVGVLWTTRRSSCGCPPPGRWTAPPRCRRRSRHLQLKQPLHQTGVGAGDHHLRPACAAAHLHQIHLHHLPLVQPPRRAPARSWSAQPPWPRCRCRSAGSRCRSGGRCG